MNPKTWVLANVLLAGVATSQAAMYTRQILPGLCNLIANELNHPLGNTVGNVLASAPPVPLVLSKLNPVTGTYETETYDPDVGTWIPGTMTLNPGDGAFLENASAASFVLTFTGALPADQACASLVSCRPVLLSRRMGWTSTGLGPSGYKDLVGFDPMEGTSLYQFVGGSCARLVPPNYNVFTFARGAWTPGPPMVAPGESVWVQVPVSTPAPAMYARAILPGVCNLIANELNACGGNNVSKVLPVSGLPAAVLLLHKFIPGSPPTYQTETYDPDAGAWAPGTMTLNPGDGAFLDSPVGFIATFRGTLPQAKPYTCLVAGQSYLLSRRAGGLGPSTYEEIVGAPPVAGSTLYQFVPGGDCSIFAAPNYVVFTYAGGVWVPAPPLVAPGESVWVQVPMSTPAMYTKAILPGVCNLIANELDACGGNNVNNVMPVSGLPPVMLALHKFMPGSPPTYQTETYDPDLGVWAPGTMILNPGDGALLDSPVGFTATFRGTLPVAKPYKCLVGGQPYLLSRRAGGLGPSTYENIVGAPPMAGSTLYQFIPGGNCSVLAAPNYTVHTYVGGAWAPAPPMVAPGESVWVQVPVSTPQVLAIARPCNGYVIQLTWGGDWQLQCADALTGPWGPVLGATSPFYYSTLPPPASRFFRLACP